MKTLWIPEKIKYDGSQLRCQYAYLTHGILGPSIVSWRGACDISFENMADGEDLLANAKICGDEMLHFIVEVFDAKLHFGVALQRLLTCIVKEEIEAAQSRVRLSRSGDDLYWNEKKLSISVAAQSPLGVVIHFAANIINSGTPVPTCCLNEFEIDPASLSKSVMDRFNSEFESLVEATMKVKPLS
jgi:hypothetical protein